MFASVGGFRTSTFSFSHSLSLPIPSFRISQKRLDQQLSPPVIAPQEFEEEDDFDYEDFEGHFHDSGEFDYVADDEVDDILFGRAFQDDRGRRRQ